METPSPVRHPVAGGEHVLVSQSVPVPIDHEEVVRNLRLPLLVFAGSRVAYRNKAADRLARWLREHYAIELITLLRDHIAHLGAGHPRDSVSLVRIPGGSHLFIDVALVDGGFRVAAIRAPGLELDAIAKHYRLSSREAEVMGYVLRGHSNRTIAELMGVTSDTIKKHLTRVFDKLGVHSRTQLMSLVS